MSDQFLFKSQITVCLHRNALHNYFFFCSIFSSMILAYQKKGNQNRLGLVNDSTILNLPVSLLKVALFTAHFSLYPPLLDTQCI